MAENGNQKLKIKTVSGASIDEELTFSPEEMRRVHSYDERLSIDNLMRGVSFFRQMLQA